MEYSVTGNPPSLNGTPQETSASPSPATATTLIGADGGPVGVITPEESERAPFPAALDAYIENV